MTTTSPIGAIGTETKGTGKTFSSFLNMGKKDEKQSEQVAYMGPSIGNILNGSTNQPTASAIRA